jgi:1-aminocyclopropane-1-carboxylate deaminase/D-cysteine desulfhydrase-like pyridoxal-dependent ACC family enzyme
MAHMLDLSRHPRFPLTALPTPLERMARLEAVLASDGVEPPRLYVKRDDMLSLALGGNKIRNLEFTIGAALTAGATDVITVGRAQSNHCRLTAAAAVKAGLRAHLVLLGPRPDRRSGNLLLDELLGASIDVTMGDDRAERQRQADEIVARVRHEQGTPYFIPVGGSDAVGALGHVLLAEELAGQLDSAGEDRAVVALATATGGTQAGLQVGFRAMNRDVVVQGYTVNNPADAARSVVRALTIETASLTGTSAFEPEVRIDGSQLGSGYGVPTAAGGAATALLARSEALVLDPTYTAKAMAGLLYDVRAGTFAGAGAVVFVHTGGVPGLFAREPHTAM